MPKIIRSVHLTEPQLSGLERLGKIRHLSVSELIRQAVDLLLEREADTLAVSKNKGRK